MKLYGRSISPGYAVGCAVAVQPKADSAPRRSISQAEISGEQERSQTSIRKAALELIDIRDRVLHELGKSHSAIFEAHLAILEDAAFSRRIEQRIALNLVNAEQAVDTEIRELCNRIEQADSPYLRERELDIRDVGRRVLSHLSNAAVASPFELPDQSILIARELLPSDTLNIDRAHLAGIVCEEGGETSHSAILARTLGVPAVSGVPNLVQRIRNGMTVLVDGQLGEITIEPSEEELQEFVAARREWEAAQRAIVGAVDLPCATADGMAVTLLANIARPEEAQSVVQKNLDGIGLLRTEFLFLDAPQPPDGDYQASIYSGICRSVEERPVVIRTLDMSADKRPRFLQAQFAHPHLSFRGLRFSLEEGELFRSQVQAIVRVAKDYNVAILLPMVVDGQDVNRALRVVQDCADEQGLIRRPPVGVMIETPAAMILLEDFIDEVDFISIGTNDLTQYVLAADREAVDYVADYSILHPAILRSIRQVAAIAAAANKPISVCGEAAGNGDVACLLVGMGIRQLSMSPAVAAQVRYRLRMNRIKELEQLAIDAMACSTTIEIKNLLGRGIRQPYGVSSRATHVAKTG